jgi:hypothetical protein
MGALFSSPKRLEDTNTLFPDSRHCPYHGNPTPEEASLIEEDSKTYYADFYEKALCVPHKDGRQVIVYWVPERWENPRETPAWAVKRLKKLYERLSSDHPRIVWYAQAILCRRPNLTIFELWRYRGWRDWRRMRGEDWRVTS